MCLEVKTAKIDISFDNFFFFVIENQYKGKASTSSARHSFPKNPKGPNISSGYEEFEDIPENDIDSSILENEDILGDAPGFVSTSGSRFGNPNQRHYHFDRPIHSTRASPFDSVGIGRSNYTATRQFMGGSNQVSKRIKW